MIFYDIINIIMTPINKFICKIKGHKYEEYQSGLETRIVCTRCGHIETIHKN
jgi:hypothetical protein